LSPVYVREGAMDDWIIESNLARYRELLKGSENDAERLLLGRLIDEEARKLEASRRSRITNVAD
jgi:hypothetical protein